MHVHKCLVHVPVQCGSFVDFLSISSSRTGQLPSDGLSSTPPEGTSQKGGSVQRCFEFQSVASKFLVAHEHDVVKAATAISECIEKNSDPLTAGYFKSADRDEDLIAECIRKLHRMNG